ncbi:MAG: MerR family transcriptional regulator [Spirochaetia bacterium]|nr:MerR family transcriptional regulator [Spirochaetia bacterium]
MQQKSYRIGELAKKCKVTVRTIRYYESLGLLKTNHRSDGGQRYYTDADVVYLNRISELKELDFTLSEIRTIILMGSEDATGEKRRNELLKQYRSKLSDALARQAEIQKRISDLSWHIHQLETNDDFQQCPGLMCKQCNFADRCRFKELS